VGEQQKNTKTISLGVNISTELKREFKKRCKELKYKERDVVESLVRLFLELKDDDAQSKMVRGEAKVITVDVNKGSISERILSGIKSVML